MNSDLGLVDNNRKIKRIFEIPLIYSTRVRIPILYVIAPRRRQRVDVNPTPPHGEEKIIRNININHRMVPYVVA
jgi:hypothetical protein